MYWRSLPLSAITITINVNNYEEQFQQKIKHALERNKEQQPHVKIKLYEKIEINIKYFFQF